MKPYYDECGVTLYQGDAREVLRTLPAASVNTCVSSPPYWSLRDYSVEPSAWGGDIACGHEWGDPLPPKPGRGNKNGDFSTSSLTNPQRQDTLARPSHAGQFCQKCGAWFGSLGLEPTPDLYVEHIVEVYREVRRVLRDDATAWINLGDSYAGSWGNYGGKNRGTGTQRDVLRGSSCHQESYDGLEKWRPPGSWTKNTPGLKSKDLVGIPWLVAFALRADGWYLRQDIIWHKPNPMPESVTDRCTKAHEYIFLLSKSARYFYNAEAIAEPCAESSLVRLSQDVDAQLGSDRVPGKTNGTMKAVGGARKVNGGASFGKQRFDASGTGAQSREYERPAYESRNRRSVWTVPTQSFSEAHFATFPPDLIKPCILAGCPDNGVVLDPFYGAGTTGEVCRAQHVRCVGIELNKDYCDIAVRRHAQHVLPFRAAGGEH